MALVQVTLIGALLLAGALAGLPPGSFSYKSPGDYGFRYAVDDSHGNEHSHQQQRGGNTVTGQYKVLLPDGRLQTVTYIADAAGYRAKVDYTPALPGQATTAGRSTSTAGAVPAEPDPPVDSFDASAQHSFGAAFGEAQPPIGYAGVLPPFPGRLETALVQAGVADVYADEFHGFGYPFF